MWPTVCFPSNQMHMKDGEYKLLSLSRCVAWDYLWKQLPRFRPHVSLARQWSQTGTLLFGSSGRAASGVSVWEGEPCVMDWWMIAILYHNKWSIFHPNVIYAIFVIWYYHYWRIIISFLIIILKKKTGNCSAGLGSTLRWPRQLNFSKRLRLLPVASHSNMANWQFSLPTLKRRPHEHVFTLTCLFARVDGEICKFFLDKSACWKASMPTFQQRDLSR